MVAADTDSDFETKPEALRCFRARLPDPCDWFCADVAKLEDVPQFTGVAMDWRNEVRVIYSLAQYD